MNLSEKEIAVRKIVIAVSVPYGTGTPVHKNRPSHGLAFNVAHDTRYVFETGEDIVCHRGECIYLPKGSSYTASSASPPSVSFSTVYAINFLTSHDDDALPPVLFRLRGKDDAEALFAKACRLWQRKDTAFREECLSLLYRIIALIKKEAAHYSQKDKVLTALSPALSYISESYLSENIPIAHLASLCHMSETYLRRLFHSAFSVSPAVYTRNLRIKYAEELLRSGEHSVTDAATLAGFNDIAYFSRTFKKATGISPREYARTYGEE